jgi:hypothetical protein
VTSLRPGPACVLRIERPGTRSRSVEPPLRVAGATTDTLQFIAAA